MRFDRVVTSDRSSETLRITVTTIVIVSFVFIFCHKREVIVIAAK